MANFHSIFDAVVGDQRYLQNLDWGTSRPGHPEGTIRAHIAELEQNLTALRAKVTEEEYWKLKLLIHTHDTFKAESRPGVPIADPESHASIARKFLGAYCDDPELLFVVQNHDEPFALFRQFKSKRSYSHERLDVLFTSIRDWNLFLAFNIIDGCTAGKSREPLRWFFRVIAGKAESTFAEADILD